MNKSKDWPLVISLAASLLLIALALYYWGAKEVRGVPSTVFILTFISFFWLMGSLFFFGFLGIGFQGDVIDRNNPAALVPLCGAVVASAVLYACGAMGEGPSYSENVFSTLLGMAGLLGLWILLELGGKVSISITEDRDLASGIRLCGFLFAASLIFGRAITGDWHSTTGTIHDFFRDGWPAFVLCAISIRIERFARPNRHRPFPPWPAYGLSPALFQVAVAAAWLWHLGRWEGMPQ